MFPGKAITILTVHSQALVMVSLVQVDRWIYALGLTKNSPFTDVYIFFSYSGA